MRYKVKLFYLLIVLLIGLLLQDYIYVKNKKEDKIPILNVGMDSILICVKNKHTNKWEAQTFYTKINTYK